MALAKNCIPLIDKHCKHPYNDCDKNIANLKYRKCQ